jgi:hypothetical protein
MRLHDSAAPPAALPALAPLLEDVPGAGGKRRPPPAAAASGGSAAAAAAAALAAQAREREQLRALKRASRRELRGAVRELRKDRQFVVRELDAAKAVRDGERAAKYKEVVGFLNGQQAEFKAAGRKPKPDRAPVGAKAAVAFAPPAAATATKADRRARKAGGGHG